MKTNIAGSVGAAGALAALLAAPVWAQTPNAPPAPAPPSAAPKMPAGSEKAMSTPHTMEGEVTKVDAKSGWIDVKTDEGRLTLHYPPPSLDSVKKGDRSPSRSDSTRLGKPTLSTLTSRAARGEGDIQ